MRLNPHLQRILVGVPQLSLSPLTGVPRRGLIRNKLRYLDTNNIQYWVVEHNTVCSAIASPYSSGDHSDYSAFLARQRIAICCRCIIEDNPLRMVVSRIANVAIGFEPITTPHVRGRSCQLSYATWVCFFTAHKPKALVTQHVCCAICTTASNKSLLRIAPLQHGTYALIWDSNPI